MGQDTRPSQLATALRTMVPIQRLATDLLGGRLSASWPTVRNAEPVLKRGPLTINRPSTQKWLLTATRGASLRERLITSTEQGWGWSGWTGAIARGLGPTICFEGATLRF
jgi:hypothetical protein